MTQETVSSESKRGKPSWARVLVPVLLLVAAVILALSLLKGLSSSSEKPKEFVLGTPPVVGEILEDFELRALDGSVRRLSEIPGKVFLINVWATWCTPCIAEMPSIVKLREKFQPEGFEVIGINVDENPEEVLSPFEKKFDMKFKSYLDREGWFADRFGVTGIPFSMVVDSSRKVLFVENGDRDWFSGTAQEQVTSWLKGADR